MSKRRPRVDSSPAVSTATAPTARPWPWPSLRFAVGLGVLIALSAGAVVFGNGNPVLGLVPLLGITVLWVILKIPLRYTALALFGALIFVDYVPENPYHKYWQSPLHFPGQLLLDNLNGLTGVPFLRAPLLVFALVFLLVLSVYRRAVLQNLEGTRLPSPSCQSQALVISLGSVVAYWGFGAVNGGNAREALWQIQQLLGLPLAAFLFHAALRGPKDFRAIGKMLIAAALWKAATAVFFIFAIVRPRGLPIEWCTSHSDTFLFVAAMVMLVVRWFEEPTGRVFIRCFPPLALITWGMVLNDRRLAYVALGISLAIVIALMPRHRLRVTFTRALIVLSPLLIAYVVVGWRAGSAIFGPVQTLRTLIEGDVQQEGVTDYRDLENFNVIFTWMKHSLLGSGFGHEFDTPLALPDISFVMPQWKYHPHNSLLWLFSNGGLLGFTLMTFHLGVTAMLAGRAYRRATDPVHRTAALVCVCALVTYLVQCFGDMGTTSWMGTFFVALASVVVGKLAIAVGAWPAPVRVQHEEAPELALSPSTTRGA